MHKRFHRSHRRDHNASYAPTTPRLVCESARSDGTNASLCRRPIQPSASGPGLRQKAPLEAPQIPAHRDSAPLAKNRPSSGCSSRNRTWHPASWAERHRNSAPRCIPRGQPGQWFVAVNSPRFLGTRADSRSRIGELPESSAVRSREPSSVITISYPGRSAPARSGQPGLRISHGCRTPWSTLTLGMHSFHQMLRISAESVAARTGNCNGVVRSRRFLNPSRVKPYRRCHRAVL